MSGSWKDIFYLRPAQPPQHILARLGAENTAGLELLCTQRTYSPKCRDRLRILSMGVCNGLASAGKKCRKSLVIGKKSSSSTRLEAAHRAMPVVTVFM